MNFATNYCKYLDRRCSVILPTCRICISSEQTNSEHFGWITQIFIASPKFFDYAGTSSRTPRKKIISPGMQLHTTAYTKAVDLVTWRSYGLLISNEGYI